MKNIYEIPGLKKIADFNRGDDGVVMLHIETGQVWKFTRSNIEALSCSYLMKNCKDGLPNVSSVERITDWNMWLVKREDINDLPKDLEDQMGPYLGQTDIIRDKIVNGLDGQLNPHWQSALNAILELRDQTGIALRDLSPFNFGISHKTHLITFRDLSKGRFSPHHRYDKIIDDIYKSIPRGQSDQFLLGPSINRNPW